MGCHCLHICITTAYKLRKWAGVFARKKIPAIENSLVVQWLSRHASTAGGLSLIADQGIRRFRRIRNLEEGDGTPLQYSCLENPMDGGAW